MSADIQIFGYRGEDGYMPGNITEIELCNFMTFSHVICKPASRLNLVIGPNGSGKSSLVCAIALGLGGEPQVSYSLVTCFIALFKKFWSKMGNVFSVAAREGYQCWCICKAR